jgi:hypothetical protein
VGFGIPVMPHGAFYLFTDASRFTEDSYKFAFELLEKAGVGAAPGVEIGREGKRFSSCGEIPFEFVEEDRSAREVDELDSYGEKVAKTPWIWIVVNNCGGFKAFAGPLRLVPGNRLQASQGSRRGCGAGGGLPPGGVALGPLQLRLERGEDFQVLA